MKEKRVASKKAPRALVGILISLNEWKSFFRVKAYVFGDVLHAKTVVQQER